MTITAADIKILASERMRDTADGGGHATAIALESGAENNMFPDVSDADRVWGYLRLRKVYAAVVTAGTDTLLGAYAILEDMPDDSAVTAWIRPSTGIAEERYGALNRADGIAWPARYESTWTVDSVDRRVLSGSPPPKAGMLVNAWSSLGGEALKAVIVAVIDLGGGAYQCSFDGWTDSRWSAGVPGSHSHACVLGDPIQPMTAKSTFQVAGSLASGAPAALCSKPLLAPLVPKWLGSYAIGDPPQIGLDPYTDSTVPAGVLPAVAAGDIVVVHHTGETTPTAVIAGDTIPCGRTSLASARVWGANGAEITTGFTTDLAAGSVYVVNPSGWSQPVYVRHRIEDVLGCAAVDPYEPGRLTFNRPLARAFPAGTLLSSALPLGDMQAMVVSLFAQGTWTATWQDSRIGGPIAAQFDDVGHPIAVLNRDAITERWAIEFLTSTTYRLFGEASGEIATGSVNTDLAPLNPATGHPYFTLAATGWSDGWAAGNVLRFNTVGASVPIWVARVVLPSAPGGGADSLTLAIKGNIDA